VRVLHVITALGVGGAERMLLKLLAARALAGFEQHVVTMLPGGALAAPVRATGAPLHELDFLGSLPVAAGALQLARLARRCDPDLVHGWLYHGNLGATLARAALPRRVPLVWGIRQSLASLEGENRFARIGITLNRVLSGRPDRLLFNSRTSLAQHRRFGFDMARAETLANGFETSAFRPDREARGRWRSGWGVAEDTVVFGVLARYHPSKDHAGFLEAARRVHEVRPATRFVLAGTGVDADNEALVRAVAAAGLQQQVHLLGERSDVASVLAALDVYVSSSASIEAFSNSVGEAMSCGLPCVVTEVGDSPFVVGDTGRVVPPRDPQALAAAMIALHDAGAAGRAALGAQARERIVAEFDIEAVATRYAALYRTLVDDVRQGR
jgi:glycosyltransferase involved in cell wall biosynthesis